jgi:hypothetical protein
MYALSVLVVSCALTTLSAVLLNLLQTFATVTYVGGIRFFGEDALLNLLRLVFNTLCFSPCMCHGGSLLQCIQGLWPNKP